MTIRDPATAHEVMKFRMLRYGWYAFALAVFAHLGMFLLWPKMVISLPPVDATWGDFREIVTIAPPTALEPPDPRALPQLEPISIPVAALPVFAMVNLEVPTLPDISLSPSSPSTPGLFPLLLNPEECEAELQAHFPDGLLGEEIHVETLLGVYVAETGKVEQVEVVESSGYPELDRIAREVVMEVARFRPATGTSGRPTPLWVGVPMGFENHLLER